MLDPAVVLFANDAFYIAFNNRDFEAMEALWSREAPAVCIHPGWRPLVTRDDILDSWREIFGNADGATGISTHAPRVVSQATLHTVVCYEQLPGGWLVATNIFVMEAGELRMIHHQAGQCMNPPDLDEELQMALQ